MSTITVKDTTFGKLNRIANERNIELDQLLDEFAEMMQESREEKFERARQYVRSRYNELYKRLA